MTYEAYVGLRVARPRDHIVDFIVRVVSDPDLGVLVLNIDQMLSLDADTYTARVHVRISPPSQFVAIKPEDYIRIHMTDEEFGLSVIDIQIIREPN